MPACKTIFSALLLKGFSSIVIQTLLIRELLIVFYGNELTFGLILAVWLLSGAIGSSILANYFKESDSRQFAFLQFILSFAAPLSLILIRLSKVIFGIPFGEAFTLGQTFLITVLSLGIPALTDGALFTMGFRLISGTLKKQESIVAKIYLWESLGVICGGMVFTFILLTLLNAFEIVLIVSLLNLFCANILIAKEPNRFYRALMAVLFFNFIALLVISPQLQKKTLHYQWKGKNLVSYKNSAYGNIAAVRDFSQYTIYYDGVPSVSIPSSETYFSEDFVHFALLSKPQVKNILFIGNAAGGLLREALKYKIEKALYVEIDPVFINIMKSLKDPATEKELNDPRVKIVFQDGRDYVRTTEEKFDCIFINAGLPTSLSINRYYTQEFFSDIKNSLKDDGIAVFKTWGSLAYLSEELKGINAVMLNTFSKIFPEIRIVPGDGFNMFLVSKIPQDYNPYTMGSRAKLKNIRTYLINSSYLDLRFQKQYLDWFLSNMNTALKSSESNDDLKPSGLYAGLKLYYSQFSKKIPKLIGGFENIKPKSLVIYILLFFAFWRWRLRHAKNLAGAYKLTVLTTGAYCLSIQIIVLFLFQSFFGSLFQWLAILTMSFMAGASLGSFFADRKPHLFEDTAKIIRLEIALPTLTTMLLLVTIIVFGDLGQKEIGRLLFFLVSVSAGLLVGLELPVVFELYKKTRRIHHLDSPKAAGIFYCLDLAGACIGALFTPLVLIPNCGIIAATQILLFIKAANAFVLWRLYKR